MFSVRCGLHGERIVLFFESIDFVVVILKIYVFFGCLILLWVFFLVVFWGCFVPRFCVLFVFTILLFFVC